MLANSRGHRKYSIGNKVNNIVTTLYAASWVLAISECFKNLFSFFPFPLRVVTLYLMRHSIIFLHFSEYRVTQLSIIYSKALSIHV